MATPKKPADKPAPAKTATTVKKDVAAKTTTKAAAKPAAKPAAKAATKAAAKPAAKPVATVKPAYPEKFTLTSMSAYIADYQGVSRKDGREILDRVFELIEAGVMQGERVPVGTLGKVHVKIRPATKPRMGRNPLTGEAIKIAAKKATKVPRFTFSKNFKETVLKAKTAK
ncbi:MAG: hypothetical protein A2087_07950 [Spirochaetes bacterium GWD1_61_31]|nr:MAG: hypothetical protein A2Y37_06190 [Spirochaetes bacterium GWB1_60_80]OHD34990.1 MAG: hypothetical protein A2004_04015 [Spirochaetes bacterium GWC1_61_12]OHD40467.1 MAG: hypothetical protein A2087_07950 [Spirochaetes bacterium GWD1_61_31]OHD43060.1 MAG: hypothetical protein A2Y35_01420 [Spirochaetes bacterium GWE1_60_18]OHD59656.1 MAG: hypothetical protein A2Y32_12300 [Spirochaetes bacterium GWF1_60_12]